MRSKTRVGKATYTETKKNNISSLLKSKFYKRKFVNTCMSSKNLAVIFDNNALKLF